MPLNRAPRRQSKRKRGEKKPATLWKRVKKVVDDGGLYGRRVVHVMQPISASDNSSDVSDSDDDGDDGSDVDDDSNDDSDDDGDHDDDVG